MTVSCCDVSVMKTTIDRAANGSSKDENRPLEDNLENRKPRKRFISRRSFLSKTIALGAGTVGAGLLSSIRAAEASSSLSRGRRGTTSLPSGSGDYSRPTFGFNTTNSAASRTTKSQAAVAIQPIPRPWRLLRMKWETTSMTTPMMRSLITSSSTRTWSPEGAAPANLDPFRTLMGSTATGVNQSKIGHRLTNLTQLTIDTSWWTRYRDDSHNPDLDPNLVFPQAVPTLAINQHTAIPRTDADTSDPNFLQAIANTAAFHFPTIEQGGNSLYPALALRATDAEVLRILMSIGPTETMHFQTWSDVAGNAPPLTAVDPVTGVSVTFPDLEVEDELFDKALIMPEPCPFLSRSLPIVSIIRPTKTRKALPWVHCGS